MKRSTALLLMLSVNMGCALCVFGQNNRALAKEILTDRDLDKVYSKAIALLGKGFAAGDGYPQVWIRDFNSFINTSCLVYSRDSIRANLLNFLRLQQPNGEIVDGYVLKGHVTWDDPNIYSSPNDSLHVGFKNTVETDQETSLIQAIAKYIAITRDSSILLENVAGQTGLQRLESAIHYLLKNRYSSRYQLLTGATTEDWGDVQIEGGAVVDIDSNTHWSVDIYDNAMFVIALSDMAGFYQNKKDRDKWAALKQKTIRQINQVLWDPAREKYIPHLYTGKSPFPNGFNENDIYFHGGTAVAIQAGLLSPDQIVKANADMLRNVKLSGASSIGLTLYPAYPDHIFPNSSATRPYVYQNGGDWDWFGGRMILQLVRNGQPKLAYDEIKPMVSRVLINGDFYEWYSLKNEPMGSPSFKGGAGVLAEAIAALKQWADSALKTN